MLYKVISIIPEWTQPIKSSFRSSSNAKLVSDLLNEEEYQGYTLHSITPILRDGMTQEILVTLQQ